MKIIADSYYLVSAYLDTGGPTTIHQLAECLHSRGVRAFLVYTENSNIISVEQKLYDWCDAPVVSKIEDKETNALIVPEISTNLLHKYKKIKKIIWWLSLDFYFRNNTFNCTMQKLQLWNLSVIFFPFVYIHFMHKIRDKVPNHIDELVDYYHLYNCEYVHEYLMKSGVPENSMHYLCGPIEQIFFNESNVDYLYEKKDQICVAFNRAKNNPLLILYIIKKLRKLTNVSIKYIKGLDKQQVYRLLEESKIYVDLGMFPGPERIPREAVALGCNILISNRGAANNIVDYPIPQKYKVEVSFRNAYRIARDISVMLDDYNLDYDDFNDLRNKVISQRIVFEENTKEIFNL